MPRRRPLPSDLLRGPFSTGDARDRGIGEHRLAAPDLEHPFHGVAVVVADRPVGLRERCDRYAPRLRDGQIFSHTTALALWAAPIPLRTRDDVHVTVAFPRTPPRTRGAIGHSLRRFEPIMANALPLSSPEAAWCESAALLSREELVAAGDALITGRRVGGRRGPGRTDPERLRDAVRRRNRLPAADRARWALSRLRVGVDSAGETELRLLLVRSGLPEPDVDLPVDVGRLVLHADLGYADARIALDYEGDIHRTDRAQWMRDIRRRELFEDAGYRHLRVVAADLRDPAPLVTRLHRLLGVRRAL
jgi:hypothetical protein